ncbi:MAG TPA: VWA domain-containing protein [Blastocatellia bacterium]|nr:VWA domain-containing protein [Blastocatellia bacterium]
MNTSLRHAVLLVSLCLASPRAAQPVAEKPEAQDEAVRLRTELVLLEAEVLNKRTGQAVGGLSKEDFLLYEDGVKQEITHFSKDKLPLSVLLLIDVSGSVWPTMKKLRDGALDALQNLKPEDEVAVMVFAERARLTLNFTKDKQLAAQAIQMAGARDTGSETNINDAVQRAAAYIKNATNPDNRRVIIAISDDVSTHKVPLYAKGQTIQELLESGGIICGLLFDSIYKAKPEPVTTPDAPGFQRALIAGETDIIKSFVERLGGVAIQADQENVKEQFVRLIERLRTRYSLGYVSSNEKRDGKFRRIRLKVAPEVDKREKGVAVSTRPGYYAKKKETTDEHR